LFTDRPHAVRVSGVKGSVKFHVNISPATGRFDITENESVVATGRVSNPTEPWTHDSERLDLIPDTESLPLQSDDVYKVLRLRGYDHGPTFHGVLSVNGNGNLDNILVNTIPG